MSNAHLYLILLPHHHVHWLVNCGHSKAATYTTTSIKPSRPARGETDTTPPRPVIKIDQRKSRSSSHRVFSSSSRFYQPSISCGMVVSHLNSPAPHLPHTFTMATAVSSLLFFIALVIIDVRSFEEEPREEAEEVDNPTRAFSSSFLFFRVLSLWHENSQQFIPHTIWWPLCTREGWRVCLPGRRIVSFCVSPGELNFHSFHLIMSSSSLLLFRSLAIVNCCLASHFFVSAINSWCDYNAQDIKTV